MSDINEILADVKTEGTDPFDDLVKDTPSESQTEKEPEAEKPTEGGNTQQEEDTPFHIRWKEREDKLRGEFNDTFENYKREIGQTIEEKTKEKEVATVPEWFRELYGDNQIAYDRYIEHEEKRTEQIEQSILARQDRARQAQVEESNKWNKWVDDEIGKLSSEGKQFDKNKLIKTMLDYRPTDTDGNFDFQAGYKIYEAMETKAAPAVDPVKAAARKELADTTTRSSGKGDKPVKDYMTAADLRGKAWGAII